MFSHQKQCKGAGQPRGAGCVSCLCGCRTLTLSRERAPKRDFSGAWSTQTPRWGFVPSQWRPLICAGSLFLSRRRGPEKAAQQGGAPLSADALRRTIFKIVPNENNNGRDKARGATSAADTLTASPLRRCVHIAACPSRRARSALRKRERTLELRHHGRKSTHPLPPPPHTLTPGRRRRAVPPKERPRRRHEPQLGGGLGQEGEGLRPVRGVSGDPPAVGTRGADAESDLGGVQTARVGAHIMRLFVLMCPRLAAAMPTQAALQLSCFRPAISELMRVLPLRLLGFVTIIPREQVNVHSGMEAMFLPYDHKATEADGARTHHR